MILFTSGFISLNLKKVYRYCLMIPYFLFNINIVSLIEIIAFYICKSNHFISDIPFSKHLQLIKIIKNIWLFCNRQKKISFETLEISQSSLIDITNDNLESQQTYLRNKEKEKKSRAYELLFFSGNNNLYNTILGFLLIVLCISFCFKNVFRFIIFLFSVLMPSILIKILFILYSIIAWLSMFKKGRDNFIQYGDFSDHFINSMFFQNQNGYYFFQNVSIQKNDQIKMILRSVLFHVMKKKIVWMMMKFMINSICFLFVVFINMIHCLFLLFMQFFQNQQQDF